MTALQQKIKEKRAILREQYGGLMSQADLCRELQVGPTAAKSWGEENRVGFRVGKRIKYDVDEVARLLVEGRGMV